LQKIKISHANEYASRESIKRAGRISMMGSAHQKV